MKQKIFKSYSLKLSLYNISLFPYLHNHASIWDRAFNNNLSHK